MDAIQPSVNFGFGIFYCFSHLATEAGYLLVVSICHQFNQPQYLQSVVTSPEVYRSISANTLDEPESRYPPNFPGRHLQSSPHFGLLGECSKELCKGDLV